MVYSILHILLLSRKMLPFWLGSVVVNDYATRKKYLGHALEYGLIFHGMRTGKYYCKNMKYRINICSYHLKYSLLCKFNGVLTLGMPPGVGILTCHRQIPCVSPLNPHAQVPGRGVVGMSWIGSLALPTISHF